MQTEKAPEVEAHLINGQMVITCPYCGEKHHHGAISNGVFYEPSYGHKSPHCWDEEANKVNNLGYTLIPPKESHE